MAKESIDYEKQYQEDLERAQALSLESLALEQFKTQQRLQQIHHQKTNKSVSRTSSMTESDSNRSERMVVKPRPRPGASTNSGPNQSLIAPPPTQQRRNSTATAPNNSEETTPDLISFSSPPANNELIDICQQLYNNLNNQAQAVQIHPNYHPRPQFASFQQNVYNHNQQYVTPSSIGWNKNVIYGVRGGGGNMSATTPPNFINNLAGGPQNLYGNANQALLNAASANLNTITKALGPPSVSPTQPPLLPPKIQPSKPSTSTASSNVVDGTSASSSSRTSSASSTLRPHRSDNLIDLDEKTSVRVSILEAFDPLTNKSDMAALMGDLSTRTISPECSVDDCASVCDSIYDEYDPYDFIYSGSGSNSTSDPLYSSVISVLPPPTTLANLQSAVSSSSTITQHASTTTGSPPPPLPPRAHKSANKKTSIMSTDDQLQQQPQQPGNNNDPWVKNVTRLYDSIQVIDKKQPCHNSELTAFHSMVQQLRNEYKYDSPNTNMGLIVSPMMDYQYRDGTSIKLCVYPHFQGADTTKPISFTCDVTSSVQHITLQLTFDVEAPSTDQYTLKVWGYNEYLAPASLLSQYEYVHNCIKLEEDVVLILIPDRLVDKSFRRTLQDDNCDKEIRLEDIIPNEPNNPISCDNLKILLETFEREVDKIITTATDIENGTSSTQTLQPSAVIQSVKLVVQLMGSLETLEISDALERFKDDCAAFTSTFDRLDGWKGSSTIKKPSNDMIQNCCERIRDALKSLIKMYSQAFRVDFAITDQNQRISTSFVQDVTDSVLIRIGAIYRPNPEWNFDDYVICAKIFYGTRPIGRNEWTLPCKITKSMCSRVMFDCWLDMQLPVSSLARESRLVLVIYGRNLSETQENNDKEAMPKYNQEEIGWAAIQFFDYNRIMVQGNYLLSIWPRESDYIFGPAPSQGIYPFAEHPVLGVQVLGPSRTVFPPVVTEQPPNGDFRSLDLQTQQQLLEHIERDMLNNRYPLELREILWDKRHYLYNIANALPKVLLASHSWEYARLADLHGMLKCWSAMKPIEAFELLLPTYPDTEVRKLAVQWINPLSTDELVDYLPQLVVALRHETYADSALARFLLDRALKSPRVAHHLFWLLSHNLPGSMPQNYGFEVVDKETINISEIRYHQRLLLMLRALLAICGEALRNCFIRQQFLVKELYEIADAVQKTKESQRLSSLHNALRNVHQMLEDKPTSLPLSPTLRVCGINIPTCSIFPSNTLPLKINFLAQDGSTIPAIFKVGDELQQDMLTLQMVRLMDKLWLKDGLDLKIVAYGCVPTGKKRGIIEMVTKAETLRKIQVEHGLTGSFKDKPIAEWLAKHNPSELEYGRAVENFRASCAGYCVVTYILGICDRHNDNIMLKTSGHLFHIDFGKFLGDAQMFGNFKRDRTPFVLTSDMAYVINGGDRPSEKFHKFVDLCCQAFNIIRNNGNLFLYLFTLMAASGIKGVTMDAVVNLKNSLLLGQSNPEAAAYFARLIESSLKSWFTQFNFFLHNLAQLKFSSDHGDGETLSFVPKTYTMETDGKLVHVQVVGYRKCYDPDKYYVYILRVTRQTDTMFQELLRTYKEFCELHQKLCLQFPLANLHSLSSGLHVGRSNIKQVAHKRYQDISLFITSLFRTADEIAHSDVVYTFFHPLLRDQQALDQLSKKVKDRRLEEEKCSVGRLKGQLKLSLHFNRGVFSVMVLHARGLPLLGTQEPSTYVKVYLMPDPTKETKRKTKVVKRNCHPSFMEMLEYRMTLDVIRERRLTATIWNYDPLQENEFLGGVQLELHEFDLTNEMTEWFPLTNISR